MPLTEQLIAEVKTLNGNLYKMRIWVLVSIVTALGLVIYVLISSHQIAGNSDDARTAAHRANIAAENSRVAAKKARELAAKVDCQATLRAKASAIGARDIGAITDILVRAAQGELINKAKAKVASEKFLKIVREDKLARHKLGSTNPKACG